MTTVVKPFILASLASLVFVLLTTSCSQDESPAVASQAPALNQPPAAPYSPNPADGASNVVAPITFSWLCYDPDLGDTLSYQVVMGPGSFTDTINLYRTTAFLVNSLIPGTDYIWKVRATDNHGASTAGPVWHFKTY